MVEDILQQLGAKPSISEERGLALLKDTDLMVFSPGISTAGFAEIRMAQSNSNRHIIATTIDQKGLDFAREVISQSGYDSQIETKLEDLRNGEYPENYFDFIYARLVLHYLNAQELDEVLKKFEKSLKLNGRIFIVVRSDKNLQNSPYEKEFDTVTKMTTIYFPEHDGIPKETNKRYYHSLTTLTEHLNKVGLTITQSEEYQERIYVDFMRQKISPKDDHIIELIVNKKNERR